MNPPKKRNMAKIGLVDHSVCDYCNSQSLNKYRKLAVVLFHKDKTATLIISS